MLIGIDASRAFVAERTGTETYSYQVISAMLRLPVAKRHNFVLFIRPGAIVLEEITNYQNVALKQVKWLYLWTQLGLAWETWSISGLNVLWVPAHTLPILRNPRVKTVVTIHGLEYKWLPEYQNWLQRWYLPLSTYYAARAADRLIAVSEATKRDIIQEARINPDKVEVTMEGVRVEQRTENIEYRNKTWEKYGVEEGKYILFVGTVQPRKNLLSLIRSFALFSRQLPQYKLVVAGAVGWQAAVVLREPERTDGADKVVFTGRVSQAELSVLYQGAQMYVQPSWTEGFGLPVLEAMAHKVPVIVSDGGALPEVVGPAGLIVPLRSKKLDLRFKESAGFCERLARAMATVARDPKLRARLVKSGRERVGELTWDQTARRTLALLEKIDH